MIETRRKCDPEFRVGALRIVRETGKPVAQVPWDLGIHEGPTLRNGVNEDRSGRAGRGRAPAHPSCCSASIEHRTITLGCRVPADGGRP